MIWHGLITDPSTGQREIMPEGSVGQHSNCKQVLKPASIEQVSSTKDVLFIGFLSPMGIEPGHVFFVLNSVTYECYGGHGVGSRPFLSEPFMRKCDYYILADT